MDNYKRISVIVDDEVLEEIKRLQKENDIFSRSELIRMIVMDYENKQEPRRDRVS